MGSLPNSKCLSLMWKKLVINRPTLHIYYNRFLKSKHPLLSKIKHIQVSKPEESRHAHLLPIDFSGLTAITALETHNLCLAEIQYLSYQFNSKLSSIVCKNIETWCDTKRFCFDLIYMHSHLKTVDISFADNGNTGFASILEKGSTTTKMPDIKKFTLNSVRDSQTGDQRDIMKRIDEVENDMDMYYIDPESIQIRLNNLLRTWDELELASIERYSPLAKLRNLSHLAFGSCYSWTSKVWLRCFLPLSTKHLTHLSISGWDQLGKDGKIAPQNLTLQPIRSEAENAIAHCFGSMQRLKYFKLTDFAVGPGLLQASTRLTHITYLDIVFNDRYIKLTNVWLLLESVRQFTLNVFREKRSFGRFVRISLHVSLTEETEKVGHYKGFLICLQSELQKNNVSLLIPQLGF
ncbi:hypothetical protein BY458DRAFT_559969 [Sporodiniella umbellata]|nr:hypothetical protein BY458DRAFT_559969 [Sporodiniella umbellata]